MLKKDRARNSPLSIGEKMTKIDYSTLKKNRRVETPVLPKKQPVVVDAFIKGVDKMPINLEDFERHNVGRFFPQLLEVEGDVNKAKKAIEEAYKAKKNVVEAYMEKTQSDEGEFVTYRHDGFESKFIVFDDQISPRIPMNSYLLLSEFLTDIVKDADLDKYAYGFRLTTHLDYNVEERPPEPSLKLTDRVKFLVSLHDKVDDETFTFLHHTLTNELNCQLLRSGYNFVCDSVTLDYEAIMSRTGGIEFKYGAHLPSPSFTWENTNSICVDLNIMLLPIHSKDLNIFATNVGERFCKVSKDSKILDLITEDERGPSDVYITKDYVRFALIKSVTGDVYLYKYCEVQKDKEQHNYISVSEILNQFNLKEIGNSKVEYYESCQNVFMFLLNHIQVWEDEHSPFLSTIENMNDLLKKQSPFSQHLNTAEIQILQQQYHDLTQYCDISLTLVKQRLLNFQQEYIQKQSAFYNVSDLAGLVEVEQQKLPSFELFVEYCVELYNRAIDKIIRFYERHEFIQKIITSYTDFRQAYMILLDKQQYDLFRTAEQYAIEKQYSTAWFQEWREQRFIILKQWLVLVEAGFNQTLHTQTVLDVLSCLNEYQQKLDDFYLNKRLDCYLKVSDKPKASILEQFEKESELLELDHRFMEKLQQIIFSLKTNHEQLWLLNYSEVWQNKVIQSVYHYIEQENLSLNDEKIQHIMKDKREQEQRTLAHYLLDAQRFNEETKQRVTNTMRLIRILKQSVVEKGNA